MDEDFRVVKIIDDKNIVINAGKNQEICLGDIFEIYELGDEVIDPETKTNLGNLTSYKADVEVKRLYENMCICVNTEKESIGKIDFGTITGINGAPKKLEVKREQISGGISYDKTIRIGHKAHKIVKSTKD